MGNLIFHFSYQFLFESLALSSKLETGIVCTEDCIVEGGYTVAMT